MGTLKARSHNLAKKVLKTRLQPDKDPAFFVTGELFEILAARGTLSMKTFTFGTSLIAS